MLPAIRRRIRFWLVAPLLLLGLLFGMDAVYGQPGRPPASYPGGRPGNPGVLPGGITPPGPGFPGGVPVNPLPNPGNPSLPLPPGFPNNPGLNPPNGIPGNPGGEVTRTCTCSKCGATFPIFGAGTPTNCAKCGVKFDIVIGDPGTPSLPPVGGPPAPLPPALTPPGSPGGFQGGPNDMTPPGGGAPPFDPSSYNSNPPPLPINASSTSKPTPGTAISTGFAIAVGFGILLLGVVLIAGVIGFIIISRSMESSSAAGHRRGPRRRRRYDD